MLGRLADYRWDSATIFRNLNDLCDCGLVARIDVGDHVWRFELLERVADTLQKHPHFLCVECGTVLCLNSVTVADTSRRLKMPPTGNVIEEVLLKGHCARCKDGHVSNQRTQSRPGKSKKRR